MNASDPQFWMMIASIIIAICFIVMAAALIAIAITVKRVVATVKRVEERIDPLITKVDAIGVQGRENLQDAHCSTNRADRTSHLRFSPRGCRSMPRRGHVHQLKQLSKGTYNHGVACGNTLPRPLSTGWRSARPDRDASAVRTTK